MTLTYQRVVTDSDGWEVLHNQTESFYDRVQIVEDEDFLDEFEMDWHESYDDEEYYFTTGVISGEFDSELPNLFEERVRRDEEDQ